MGLMAKLPAAVPQREGRWQWLRSRRTTRAAWLLLALLALAASLDATRLWQHQRRNALITEGQPIAETDAADVPELRFASAHALASRDGSANSGAGSGAGSINHNTNEEAALNRYRTLQGDSALGQAARFNSANLLLRQAQKLQASDQRGPAVPLVELAKETLREVLRNDPQHWPARYNLERAQRLLPDPDDGDSVLAEPPQQAERSATTMRGYSPGLP